MTDERKLGFLEKAIRIIPGYKGYKGKEERRDNDHLFRMMLVGRLDELRKTVNNVISRLKGPAAFTIANGIDSIIKKLEKVQDEIRFADRGYRGWFDMHKVREGELDKLYEFDVNLNTDMEDIETAFMNMKSASSEDIPAKVDVILVLLEGLSAKVGNRSALMIDIEKNKPID